MMEIKNKPTRVRVCSKCYQSTDDILCRVVLSNIPCEKCGVSILNGFIIQLPCRMKGWQYNRMKEEAK